MPFFALPYQCNSIVMGNYIDEQKLIFENNLPSERWKIRRIRTAHDKKLLRTEREYNRVCRLIWDLGYEDLNPPIQRGYKRLFVLTEETRYSKRIDFYQRILDKINTVWYSPCKVFKERKRKIAKWKYQQRKEQKLQEPDDWTFNRKKFTEEEISYFFPVEYYNYSTRSWSKKYIFNEPWRFQLRVKPNILTKVQRKDLELEQYRDELKYICERNRSRLTKLRGGGTNAWNTWQKKHTVKEKYKYNPLSNQCLHQIMEAYHTEKE